MVQNWMNLLCRNALLTGMDTKERLSRKRDDPCDRDLLARVADRDRRAFDVLFQKYQPRLLRFVYRLTSSYQTSEEIVSDILYVVWDKAGSFRGDALVSTWIYGIAYRKTLDRLRKRRFTWLPLRAELPGDDVDASNERADWVQSGILNLPPKQRLTVMLVFYLGLTYEETSQATGVPVNTVKTRMFHARRALKEYLGNEDD